jgi:hypothetical protein
MNKMSNTNDNNNKNYENEPSEPPNINVGIWNFLIKNPLELVSGWLVDNNSLFSFEVLGSKTYVAKNSDEHVSVFQTKHKDDNSIKVFERASPGSVFNQQENTWEERRFKHPYVVLGNEWINLQKSIIDNITNNRFSKLKNCDLYNTVHRLLFEITYITTFGNMDWDAYDYFNYQTPSVNRQLTYGTSPMSLWYFYGRDRWFDCIKKSARNATDGSLVSEMIKKNVLVDDNFYGELSGLFWGGMFSLTNLITTSIYYVSKNNIELERLLENPDVNSVKIIKESLRICSGAPLLVRTLNADLKLDNCELKKDSDVMVCPFALHRDPAYWNDASKFDSFRHTSDDNYCSDGFMPFGVPVENGGRACVAREFALTLAKNVIVTLFSNYNVSINSNDDYCVEPYCGAVRPTKSYPMKIE